MKKLLALLLSLTLVFSLAACGETIDDGYTATERPVVAEPVVFNWNIGADPKTLDPSLNGASDGGDVINNTFEGLVREFNGEVLPGIAKSWDISEDGKTITFHLRESNWSNGDPLTAHDFVYGWKHGMDPATGSEYSWLWHYTNVVGSEEAVDGASLNDVGIEATDDYTFVVQLKQPTDYFVSLTAFYHFMPLHQASVEAVADGMWAKTPAKATSNGPYMLTSYELGKGLVLEKNPEYWNADNVQIEVINGKFIDSAYTAFAAFQNDDLDYIPSVPPSEVTRLIAEDNQFYVFPLLGTYYYSFNLDLDVWQNAKLRTALSLSIDREAIVEAMGGIATPATGVVPPGFTDHEGNDFYATAGNFGVETDSSKFEEAKTLLDEALAEMGYAGVEEFPTDLVILYNTSEGHKLVAEMVQQMWKENLGISVDLQNQDWAVFQGTRKAGDFDIARGGWLTDYMDPSGMLSIFTSENAYNDPNFYNDEYDTLMNEAMAATDKTVHFEKLYAAQEVFMNEMPIVPVYHYSDSMYVKSYVKNWGRSVLGSVDFSQARIDK
ncbi:peptide ABC transporter substrate-binding protein [Mycoplasmatota bacterium WC44]